MTTMNTATTTNAKSQAEALRLQGNEAFAAGNWEVALELYDQSNEHHATAKCHSNIAATLCKMGEYKDASKAAAKATEVDPTWAKGWWRRGLCCELEKDWALAAKYYEKAVEVDPKDQSFQRSLKDAEKQLKVVEKTEDGMRIIEPTGVDHMKNPSLAAKAWKQANKRLGCHFTRFVEEYDAENKTNPNSEQWLVKGMICWVSGLKSAIAHLAYSADAEACQNYNRLMMLQHGPGVGGCFLFLSEESLWDAVDDILGGQFQNGHQIYGMTNAIAHLGGRHLFLEAAGGGRLRENYTCPPPPALENMVSFQSIAISWTIEHQVHNLYKLLGPSMKCSPTLLEASRMVCATLRMDYPRTFDDPQQTSSTPQAIVDYMKRLLADGTMDWDAEDRLSLRDYASAQYRGNIMYGFLMALFGQLAQAYKALKWANDFIKLADEEFAVSKDKDYKVKGSAFMPSLRVGIVMALFEIHNELVGESGDSGPYTAETSIDLCLEIVDLAHCYAKDAFGDTEYARVENDAFYRRKPLALAHSSIGALLNTYARELDLKDFKEIATRHGFIDNVDAPCDPHGLVAEQYRLAAENELEDDENCAIYWWAYAGNIVRALPQSKFTLGQLRHALAKAEAAEEARNVDLFGENQLRGGSYENMGKLVAMHFKDKPDSCLVPTTRTEYHFDDGDERRLCIGDEVICENFHQFDAADYKRNEPNAAAVPDTSELEKLHGEADKAEVSTHETRWLQELQKSSCEYTFGETDGDVMETDGDEIHQDAMVAEAEQMAE